jgi:hypothetical protein
MAFVFLTLLVSFEALGFSKSELKVKDRYIAIGVIASDQQKSIAIIKDIDSKATYILKEGDVLKQSNKSEYYLKSASRGRVVVGDQHDSYVLTYGLESISNKILPAKNTTRDSNYDVKAADYNNEDFYADLYEELSPDVVDEIKELIDEINAEADKNVVKKYTIPASRKKVKNYLNEDKKDSFNIDMSEEEFLLLKNYYDKKMQEDHYQKG